MLFYERRIHRVNSSFQPSAVGIVPSRVVPFDNSNNQRAQDDVSINNPARRMGLYFALAVVFLRYSLLHEVLAYFGGFNTRLLYVFSIPALLLLFGSNGLSRAFSSRTTKYWLLFIVWLFITVPFSYW